VIAEPSWAKLNAEAFARATPEQLEAWRAELVEAQKSEQVDAAERSEKWKRGRALLLEAVRGPTHEKVARYLRQVKPYFNGTDWKYRFETMLSNAKRIQERQAEEEKAKEKAAEQDAKAARAIVWLQERGKKLGDDFTPATAIAAADDVAFNEEIVRRVAAISQTGPIDFNGNADCENCEGWDGESRRCWCGNRRVGWERGYGHSFEEPCVQAEAW